MAFDSYARLLRAPNVARLLLAALLSRLPNGFANLALVIVVSDAADSYAVAGLAVAVSATCGGIAAPIFGRLVDRVGQTRVLIPVGVGEGLALAGMGVASWLGAAVWGLVLLAVPFGFLTPPVAASLRALWTDALPRDVAPDTAYSLESAAQELIWVVGPLLAAVVIAVADAEAALVVAGALALTGTVWFASLRPSREWRPQPHGGRGRGVMRVPAVRALTFVAAALVVSLAMVEVSVVAFAEGEGQKGAAGIVLSLWAVASMAGGVVHGGVRWRRPVRRRIRLFAMLLPLGFVPLLAAWSTASLAVLIMCAGVAIAPLLACIFTLIGEVSPPTGVTEAFSWLNTAFITGAAIGAAVGGAVVEAGGARAGFAVVVAAGCLAPVVLFLQRRSLGPGAAAAGGAPAG